MSFRSSAQAEDFDLLARMDVRYMLGSRINIAGGPFRVIRVDFGMSTACPVRG